MLILAGTNSEFAGLEARLAALTDADSLQIHTLPDIVCHALLKLTVLRSGSDRIIRGTGNDYTWHLDAESQLEAVEKIRTLAKSGTVGHQYFACHPSDGVSIQMSAGEHDFLSQPDAAGG